MDGLRSEVAGVFLAGGNLKYLRNLVINTWLPWRCHFLCETLQAESLFKQTGVCQLPAVETWPARRRRQCSDLVVTSGLTVSDKRRRKEGRKERGEVKGEGS